MVIAAPGDDDWTIAYAEGTTTANAMSTFDDGDSRWN